MKTALTIAGSDSSAGAGIQADIKAMLANGVYATSAITSLTAQNTKKVAAIYDVSPDFLACELDCIFTDIRPDAVKIGMVSTKELIEVIAKKLKEYEASNIVIDTVMVSSSGTRLIQEEGILALKTKLFKMASLLTPNIPEMEILTATKITSRLDMIKAAKILYEEYGTNVLCKGGHSLEDADDLLFFDGDYAWFESEKIKNPNTHGTGCTLSSAIASNLAKGYPIYEAVKRGKAFVTGAINARLNLGEGNGPLNLGFAIDNEFTK